MNDNKDRADSRDTKSASSLASRSSSPETTSPEAIDSHNKPVSSAANCPCLIWFPEPEVYVLPCGWFSPLSSISLPIFYQVGTSDSSSLYKPPDLNRNITQIFGKLLNIYRGRISVHMIYFYSFSHGLWVNS